jgi:hypothetical protein
MGHGENNESGRARNFFSSLRPVALFVTLSVIFSPFVWIVAHFWSLPPAAFVKAWYLEPEFFLGFWLACASLIWAWLAVLLVLTRIAATRPLVMRNGVNDERFIRHATEVTLFWTVITILTASIWYGLSGR